jgi:hypothetical protein
MADVERAFLDFMNKVPFYGAVTACVDDPLLKGILPRARRRVFTYGVAAEADFRLEFLVAGEGRFARFQVNTAAGPLGPFELRVPGRHNVLNATAAVAIARQLEVPADKIAEGLSAARRAASPWWTTTATIPRKFAPLLPPPASAATGGSTSSSSPTGIRALSIFWTSSAGPSPMQTP